MISHTQIPHIIFMHRQGDHEPDQGGCPIGGEFVPVSTTQLFAHKRVVVFSLPGAFTPTCSSQQVPQFEQHHADICRMGIDEIYVSSVNDAFVMNAWANMLGIQHVKTIADGNGHLTASMGMLTDMTAVGFGQRSRRFAAVINNGVVEQGFVEPNPTADNDDPYGVSSPATVMAYLKSTTQSERQV